MCVCDAAVPVHDVGGEGGGEADHVEAELGGRAQRQAGHDGEEGQVHPQACRTRARGKAAAGSLKKAIDLEQRLPGVPLLPHLYQGFGQYISPNKLGRANLSVAFH